MGLGVAVGKTGREEALGRLGRVLWFGVVWEDVGGFKGRWEGLGLFESVWACLGEFQFVWERLGLAGRGLGICMIKGEGGSWGGAVEIF